MRVLWVESRGNDALAAMEAVEAALERGESTVDPAEEEALRYLRANAAIDTERIVASDRAGLGSLLTGFRRLVRRLTWWLYLPQWGQVSETARVEADLLARLADEQRRLREEIARLRADRRALERRVRELEERP
jgi:hypothetical protein